MRSHTSLTRKQIEEALRKSEEKFSKAFRESPLALALTSAQDHRYIEINETFEQMTGWKRDEVIGRTPYDIGIWFDPGQRADVVKTLLSGLPVRNLEIRLCVRNGEIRTGLGSAELIEIEGEPCILSVTADVTDLKRAEAALRESEERFRRVANTAPVMIWMSGVDKLCTYFNQGWLEFTGRSLGAELGNGWVEAVHPEDFDRCLDTYTKAFDRREPFHMEYRLRRHDGVYRWILDQGVARFNADGSFAGYIGSGIDVTESKLAKEALQKSDERLRLAMDSGKSVGWDRDVKSGRDSLFGDLRGIFGIPSEVYEGQVEDFYRYLHPEDRTRILEAIEDAMLTRKPYAAEFRVLRPDGTVRWLAAKGRFYYSRQGEPERMLGVAIDITDRRLAEEALRESEERLRLAVQAGRMYAFDWNVLTDAIVRSEESTRIFGLTGDPTRLTKRELLSRVHPEDLAAFMSSIAQCTPESPNTQITYRLLRPDGSILWLERNGHAFFDQKGKMVRMIGMVADITERKLAEQALSTVSQKLIEAHEEERTRIARELHDDVGQRLALLAVNIEGLKKDPQAAPAELGSQISEIKKQIEDLASDVQTLSHSLHPPKLKYLGLAAAAAGFCRELSDSHGVKIEFHSVHIPKELPPEISLSLFRVLQEALQNATKHSGSRTIHVLLEARPNEVALTVHDSGIGFEPEKAVRGRGLGLTSMRERLKLVHGQLSIESKPQGGTTIHARVPLTLTERSARAAG